METKEIVALLALLVLGGASTLLTTVSQRARDAVFFLLVAGAVLTERMDVNFFGEYWYRGTTRGVEISLLDVLAISLLVGTWLAPRYPGRRAYWPASLGAMLLYFLYCAASLAWSQPRLFGVWELSKVLRGIVVFLAAAQFVRTRREVAILVAALGCAVCLQGAFGLKQRYLGGIYRVGGTLDHANSLSMYLCLVSPVFVAAATSDLPRWLRRFSWLGASVAAVGIMLTISRAGIPIFALVMLGTAAWCVSWRITVKKIAVACAVLLGAGLLVLKSWDLLAYRYGEATLAEEYLDDQSEGRGVYLRWAAAIVEDHFLGVGLNNWSYWVSKVYGPRLGFEYEDYDEIQTQPEKADLPSIRYAAPAHSLAALTVGELGVPGLVLFGLMWLRWFQMGAGFLRRRRSDPMFRLGVGLFFGTCGIFMQSTTEWTYRQTAIFFTFNLMLGALASLCHHRRHETAADEDVAAPADWAETDEAAAELEVAGLGGQ